MLARVQAPGATVNTPGIRGILWTAKVARMRLRLAVMLPAGQILMQALRGLVRLAEVSDAMEALALSGTPTHGGRTGLLHPGSRIAIPLMALAPHRLPQNPLRPLTADIKCLTRGLMDHGAGKAPPCHHRRTKKTSTAQCGPRKMQGGTCTSRLLCLRLHLRLGECRTRATDTPTAVSTLRLKTRRTTLGQ